MILTLIVIVAVLVIGFLVFVSTRPATFRYERRLAIAAPAAELFDQVNDLRRFQDWNPWAKLDPQCQVIYTGLTTGTGAAYEWKGNRKVGEGALTITDSRPHKFLRMRLEFRKPFAATNTGEFTFTPEGGGTLVVWAMHGENNFMSRLFNVFVDCEKMIGADFEKGLAGLKTLAEAKVAQSR